MDFVYVCEISLYETQDIQGLFVSNVQSIFSIDR